MLRAGFVLLILLVTLNLGCLPVFVPTTEYGPGLSEGQVAKLLQPDTTTRADVLLSLGAPSSDWYTADEKFFFYHWNRFSHYLAVIFLPIPVPLIGAVGPPAPTVRPGVHHFSHLGLEFTPDGILKRYKYFTFPIETGKEFEQDYLDWYASESEQPYIPKAVRDWMAEESDDKPPD